MESNDALNMSKEALEDLEESDDGDGFLEPNYISSYQIQANHLSFIQEIEKRYKETQAKNISSTNSGNTNNNSNPVVVNNDSYSLSNINVSADGDLQYVTLNTFLEDMLLEFQDEIDLVCTRACKYACACL